jgi:hypothetical protein
MTNRSSRSEGAGGGGHGDRRRYHYSQLTPTNYTSWSIQVQAIMEDQGVWEVVEPPDLRGSAKFYVRARVAETSQVSSNAKLWHQFSVPIDRLVGTLHQSNFN